MQKCTYSDHNAYSYKSNSIQRSNKCLMQHLNNGMGLTSLLTATWVCVACIHDQAKSVCIARCLTLEVRQGVAACYCVHSSVFLHTDYICILQAPGKSPGKGLAFTYVQQVTRCGDRCLWNEVIAGFSRVGEDLGVTLGFQMV